MPLLFLAEEDGITAMEYGLIGTLIVVTAMGAITALGDAVADNLYDIIEATAAII
ncbi:MAG TPA: Flp family type IVb pilin [Myxococcota bacterium]|nr:Flp family type IVb pilin [Myxococcota bacterium]